MSDYRAAIERDGCKHSCNTSKICVCAMIEDADDEIKRLREALRWIADNPFDGENPAHLMRLTARFALGEGKE